MRRRGRRRLDRRQAQRVKPQTIETYRREARAFTTWALANDVNPVGSDQCDDVLVEYRNACGTLRSPSKLFNLQAAVEQLFPRVKGGLKCAHAALRG